MEQINEKNKYLQSKKTIKKMFDKIKQIKEGTPGESKKRLD